MECGLKEHHLDHIKTHVLKIKIDQISSNLVISAVYRCFYFMFRSFDILLHARKMLLLVG